MQAVGGHVGSLGRGGAGGIIAPMIVATAPSPGIGLDANDGLSHLLEGDRTGPSLDEVGFGRGLGCGLGFVLGLCLGYGLRVVLVSRLLWFLFLC